jgi:hypothetical protein
MSYRAVQARASEAAPSNKAFKLTRSHGLRRMEALRATMRRCGWPSQLNAMFDGPGTGEVGRRDG